MKLLSLALCNFRPFYGKQPKIVFSHGNQNITVIHASNGAGKTALLNAFTWTLFDSFTPGFLLPDQIVNKRAIRETKEGDTIEAWVEIEFEHDEKRYKVRRTTQARRISTDPGYETLDPQPPTLQWTGLKGEWRSEEQVFDIIGKILPKDLHTYFFFDGERIERIVKPTKKEKDEIGRATKKLLGIEIFLRAITHLDSVRRDLERELTDIGDAETTRLYTEKREKEERLKETEERQDEINRNIDAHEARKKEIGKRLGESKEVEGIAKRRDQLNNDRRSREDSLEQGSKNLASTISSFGFTFFIREPIEKYRNLIESLRKRGELPAGIKKQFVNDLLNVEVCICDRDLSFNSESRNAVEKWMEKAGLSDVEEKAIRMGGETTTILQHIPEHYDRIDQIQQKRDSDRRELSRIEIELDDIKEKLRNNPREEISELQRQLSETEDVIKDLFQEQGEVSHCKRKLEDELIDLQREISSHEVREDRQKIAQRRVDASVESIKRIREIRDLFEVEVRKRLQKKMSKLFSTISTAPYVPTLNQDYSLQLLESAGGSALPVAASQSESQILSLSFIGSIMEVAREDYAKQKGLPTPDTSTYPVVMDSPFGNLDPIYRHQIAEHVPALADQVVVLVTKSQWRGEVERSMEKRIGRSYVVTYYSSKTENLKLDSIEIRGRSWELIKASPNDFEYSEIGEATYGG